MSIGATDRIEMSQRERDVLTVMRAVLRGDPPITTVTKV
jgi:hypothetical protein